MPTVVITAKWQPEKQTARLPGQILQTVITTVTTAEAEQEIYSGKQLNRLIIPHHQIIQEPIPLHQTTIAAAEVLRRVAAVRDQLAGRREVDKTPPILSANWRKGNGEE